MSIFSILRELGLASNDTAYLFHKGVRDNPNIDVYRDSLSGVIYINDFYVGNDEYLMGDYRDDCLDEKQRIFFPHMDFSRHSYCKRRVSDFSPYYIGKDILDFGCGHGDFLLATKDLAKSSSGVELQSNLKDHLNSLGVRVENSISAFQDDCIDSLFLLHSFEHLEDPLELLFDLKSKIRKNGHIIIEVPSANDFLISVLQEKSYIDFVLWSQHLILHTETSLRRFLEYSGYHNIFIKGLQRYPLSNHLHWITHKRPGGHISSLYARY